MHKNLTSSFQPHRGSRAPPAKKSTAMLTRSMRGLSSTMAAVRSIHSFGMTLAGTRENCFRKASPRRSCRKKQKTRAHARPRVTGGEDATAAKADRRRPTTAAPDRAPIPPGEGPALSMSAIPPRCFWGGPSCPSSVLSQSIDRYLEKKDEEKNRRSSDDTQRPGGSPGGWPEACRG